MNEEVTEFEQAAELDRADAGLGIIELRRYRLYPGTRERLIDLFDREFVETQEAVGIEVLGQFRDLDDPDCFVWLRGFPDMASRARSLSLFYGGPVWVAYRDVANSTMVNSDNVLLLRPHSPQKFALSIEDRMEREAKVPASGFVLCTTCFLKPNAEHDFADFFEREIAPQLRAASARIELSLIPERSANTFPRLPVREGESVFLWLASFPDVRSYATYLGRVTQSEAWTSRVLPEMEQRTWRRNEDLRLAPTLRSRIR